MYNLLNLIDSLFPGRERRDSARVRTIPVQKNGQLDEKRLDKLIVDWTEVFKEEGKINN